jgi:hypothetical protein
MTASFTADHKCQAALGWARHLLLAELSHDMRASEPAKVAVPSLQQLTQLDRY